MPQMAPISWLFLFIIFIITLIMFNVFNYYSKLPKSPDNIQLENNKYSSSFMSWKW